MLRFRKYVRPTVLALTFTVSLSACIGSKNLGHRLGADVIHEYPENSLALLKEALRNLQFDSGFQYIEFDVRESSTGELVVFHDATVTRMVNKKNKGEVQKTPFTEIREYCLNSVSANSCYQIPTPDEVLKLASSAKFKKPIMIDIKSISEQGKSRLLATADEYMNDLSIDFIMSKRAFKELFNNGWCSDFSDKGYFVMEVGKDKNPETNNLCE